jgi:SAM-dependent methyltransferase
VLFGQPEWLLDLLICPLCGMGNLEPSGSELKCRNGQTGAAVQGGVIDLRHPDLGKQTETQEASHRSLEQARGRHHLSIERVLRIPEEPATQEYLAWLREVLRAQGCCRVLEIAAGCGWASRALAEDGHHVVASDLSNDEHIGLGCAVRLRTYSGLLFGCVLAGAEHLPFQSDSFDCIFCFDTLKHIVDLQRVFQEAARVLRPGGILLALDEPFRGAMTTPLQRLQDSFSHKVARWWVPGALPKTACAEVVQLRGSLGSTFYDGCRRAGIHLDAGRSAGLRTTVLPRAVALAMPGEDVWDAAPSEQGQLEELREPAWLSALVNAYVLDRQRVCQWVAFARESLGFELIPQLLAHWTHVGNPDGVVLAQKRPDVRSMAQESPQTADWRRLDRFLLGCAALGFVPIYGFHETQEENGEKYHWLQPQAGFLIAGGESFELTITSPPRYYRNAPARIEIRLDDERMPTHALMIFPEKTVTLRVPIPQSAARQPSILVRLTAHLAFIPSDYNPKQIFDSRLLALRLRKVHAGRVEADEVRGLQEARRLKVSERGISP